VGPADALHATGTEEVLFAGTVTLVGGARVATAAVGLTVPAADQKAEAAVAPIRATRTMAIPANAPRPSKR
jgi:hypothetical protein